MLKQCSQSLAPGSHHCPSHPLLPLQYLCVQALLLAAKDRQPGSSYEVTTPEALLGAIVFDACILQSRCGLSTASLESYEAQCFEAAKWSQLAQRLAAQLEQQLLDGGFSPTISAAQLHLVRIILCHQSAAARFSITESGIFAGMIKTAGEQMVRLDRSSLGLQLRRAMFLAHVAAAPLTCSALHSQTFWRRQSLPKVSAPLGVHSGRARIHMVLISCASPCLCAAHLCASVAAAQLAVCLMAGGSGPQWSVVEVRSLVVTCMSCMPVLRMLSSAPLS